MQLNFKKNVKNNYNLNSYIFTVIISSIPLAPTTSYGETISSDYSDKISLSGDDTLLVTSSGNLSTNSDKAVSIKSAPSINVNIENIGNISSEDDAINAKAISTSSGYINIDNSGTISTTISGQAIDLNDVTSTDIVTTIVNGETGVISSLGGDAMRPGSGATVINSGTIYTEGPAGESYDGVDFQGNDGTVINKSGGLISGMHHGITSDINVNVTNEAGATIIGRNGSGVGSDGTGTVINYGTIIGTADGSGTSDGDGIDIDGSYYVVNYGTIEGQGAAGVDKGGSPNVSEGVALTGGGTLINMEGALITSVDYGATLCCTANAANFTNYGIIYGSFGGMSLTGNVTGENFGEISSDGIAITISEFDDNSSVSITNHGSIDGLYGVYADNDAGIVNIDNYGSITGKSNAIQVNSGSIMNLTGEAGSAINGAVLINGQLNLITPADFELSSALAGLGAVTKSGAADLLLTGDNSGYTGVLTIAEGSLTSAVASLGSGTIVDNASLIIDQNADAIFDKSITGTGTFTKTGVNRRAKLTPYRRPILTPPFGSAAVIPVVDRRGPRTTTRTVRCAGGGVRGRSLLTHRVNRRGWGSGGRGFGLSSGF